MAVNGGVAATAGLGAAAQHPGAPASSDATREKKDLASWWKNFKRGDKKAPEPAPSQGIFGVPLQVSIRYANVAISLFNEEGQSYIYGYVPIVVAKCGVFLKEKATDVEGIFRLAGSEKRIKELKAAFDSPDRYGKGLDWTGYTVHDAANILRRYFNLLPEPIIPLDFYERFREPLRHRQAQAAAGTDTQNASAGAFDTEAAIRTYQGLITELPPLNRQLLLYILDLLAVFASKSDLNKMTTSNLSAIFQPGILSHPRHDMAPQEYLLSQDVLIFLIENQDSFLIGMQGTAADAETVRDVQSGGQKAPGTPPQFGSRSAVNRSGSINSSIAGDSGRKLGSIRRNLSVSSKHSRRSDAASMGVATPPSGAGGVHRSNTVPSRRGGSNAAPSPRFQRDSASASPSPAPTPKSTQNHVSSDSVTHGNPAPDAAMPGFLASIAPVAPPIVTTSPSSEAEASRASDPAAATATTGKELSTPSKEPTTVLVPPGGSAEKASDKTSSATPSNSSGRKFLDILKQSPATDGETRKPNKLQKRRVPSTSLSSAHSSSHSLQDHSDAAPRSPISPRLQPGLNHDVIPEIPDEATPRAASVETTQQLAPGDSSARPAASPAPSLHSHADYTSDADMVGDDMPAQVDDGVREKKRNRWRFSRSPSKIPSAPAPLDALVATTAWDQGTSRTTIDGTVAGSSAASQPRRSFQDQPTLVPNMPANSTRMTSPDRSQLAPSTASADPVFSDSERERKGPMSWIRGKIQERKESRDAEKRSRTPDRGPLDPTKSQQDLVRGPVEPAAALATSSHTTWMEPSTTNGIPAPLTPAAVVPGPSPLPSEDAIPAKASVDASTVQPAEDATPAAEGVSSDQTKAEAEALEGVTDNTGATEMTTQTAHE